MRTTVISVAVEQDTRCGDGPGVTGERRAARRKQWRRQGSWLRCALDGGGVGAGDAGGGGKGAGGHAAVRAADADGVFPLDNAAQEFWRRPGLVGTVEDAVDGGDVRGVLMGGARRRSYSSRGSRRGARRRGVRGCGVVVIGTPPGVTVARPRAAACRKTGRSEARANRGRGGAKARPALQGRGVGLGAVGSAARASIFATVVCQRYHLLDGARVAGADLPADNLVSARIGLEKTRDAAGLREALQAVGAFCGRRGTTT